MTGLLLLNKEDIPSPLTDVSAARVEDFRTIPEDVAILIDAFRFLVIETDGINAQVSKCMEFAWL